MIKEYLQPVCNIIPVVSMADTFCQKELTDYKIKILRQANTCGLRFYNCIESSGIQDFDRFPFAVMNPNKISGRGDFGRERIDGSFMSSSSSALDFSHLSLMVFKEMSDSLVKTTELIMNDYLREMDKAVQRENKNKLKQSVVKSLLLRIGGYFL